MQINRSVLNRAHLPGFVYLAFAGGLHKIGQSGDPHQRIKAVRSEIAYICDIPEIKGASPKIVHVIPTNNRRIAERVLHLKFADKRRIKEHTCEWFQLDANDISWIQSLTEVNIVDLPLREKKSPGGRCRIVSVDV